MNREKLEALIEEATVDCYDEHEQFWGMLATLQDALHFPFPAFVLGEFVTVTGIDEGHSNERRGIMVAIEKDGDEYSFPLAELQSGNADEHNAEWIAAYKLWSE
jgi:hypothetical protein